MATQLEYQQKIRTCNWKDLADLWQQIEERTTSDYEQKILNR